MTRWQYPYKLPSLATGLALSPGVASYPFHDKVLFPALAQDPKLGFNFHRPPAADLTHWATRAGVLLLNASLQDEDASLWKPFLTKVIGAVCDAAGRATRTSRYETSVPKCT